MTEQLRLRHFMVDVETLGLAINAATWQLAIREFEFGSVDGGAYPTPDGFNLNCLVDPDTVSDNINHRKQSYSSETIQWTLSQPSANLFREWACMSHGIFTFDDVRNFEDSLKAAPVEVPVPVAQIGEIHTSIMAAMHMSNRPVHFWSKGKEFDKPILENMFTTVGLKAPWEYYRFHCVRDAFGFIDLVNHKEPERRRAKTHNAYDDCGEQIELLAEMTKRGQWSK